MIPAKLARHARIRGRWAAQHQVHPTDPRALPAALPDHGATHPYTLAVAERLATWAFAQGYRYQQTLEQTNPA